MPDIITERDPLTQHDYQDHRRKRPAYLVEAEEALSKAHVNFITATDITPFNKEYVDKMWELYQKAQNHRDKMWSIWFEGRIADVES